MAEVKILFIHGVLKTTFAFSVWSKYIVCQQVWGGVLSVFLMMLLLLILREREG